MDVLIDHQCFTYQRFGGVSQCFSELSKSLPDVNVSVYIPPILSYNEYYRGGTVRYTDLGRYGNYGRYRIMDAINKRRVVASMRNRSFDIFHPTYYDPYFLKHLGRKPFVLTVYDMIHELYPYLFHQWERVSENKQLLIERADRVIAISEHTKQDIISILGTDPLKIEVVHLATSITPDPRPKQLPYKYILYVGGLGSYKCSDEFLPAIKRILKDDPNLYFVRAGGNPQTLEELSCKQMIHVPITKGTLPGLYQHAEAFVFPSLYEGFGIPVLEAFACGCPVACSNTSSFPEVARDAAAMFDPLDIESIIHAIQSAMNNRGAYSSSKGKDQLQKFSWHKTAMKTSVIYHSVMCGNDA
jgi:glycosyltransferase involved in cell wall biosynthesis